MKNVETIVKYLNEIFIFQYEINYYAIKGH